ncbi:hypothetical protein AADZ91_15645 [Colwelliaceae bacterium 6441]
MSASLPISINVNEGLIELFPSLQSITNKLEAQFNFQTMTAGWYGDEENIIDICLSIETLDSFKHHTSLANENIRKDHADDVVSFFDGSNSKIDCYVALTESENLLLKRHNKLLKGFIETKLIKVLNLIAIERSLCAI